jgi:hypothetical protein
MSTTLVDLDLVIKTRILLGDLEEKLGRMPWCSDIIREMGNEGIDFLKEIASGAYLGLTKWENVVDDAFRVKYMIRDDPITLTSNEYDVLEFIADRMTTNATIVGDFFSSYATSTTIPKLEGKGFIQILERKDHDDLIFVTELGMEITEPGKKKAIRVKEDQYSSTQERFELWKVYYERFKGVKPTLLSILEPGLYHALDRSDNLDIAK